MLQYFNADALPEQTIFVVCLSRAHVVPNFNWHFCTICIVIFLGTFVIK